MNTTRLYFQDSYLAEFSARIVHLAGDGRRIYLDRTAFYPSSGGQPHDLGCIGGVPVVDVIDEEARIAHVTSEPVEGVEVACQVEWARRFDHMQQHTGQHLLSAVLVQMHGAVTVSFHLGSESSTIDVAIPSLDAAEVAAIETRANQRIVENRPVQVSFETAAEAQNLRKPSEREGVLRIVAIEGLDRSPCGGTHVRATGEIGPLLIRKLDKIRGNVRIEFLCGMRAVRRARTDYDALARISRLLASPLDETPAVVAARKSLFEAAEKARRRAETELAGRRGRELYEATLPGPDGVRRVVQRLSSGALDEELRALAQGFVAQAKSVFVAAVEEPPSVLLAVSPDTGIHAGNSLKAALSKFGGRGGGSALAAQGSIPSREHLDGLLTELP
jgi:alanyl-tRNA synthetase